MGKDEEAKVASNLPEYLQAAKKKSIYSKRSKQPEGESTVGDS